MHVVDWFRLGFNQENKVRLSWTTSPYKGLHWEQEKIKKLRMKAGSHTKVISTKWSRFPKRQCLHDVIRTFRGASTRHMSVPQALFLKFSARVCLFLYFSTRENDSVSISSKILNPESRVACFFIYSLYFLLSGNEGEFRRQKKGIFRYFFFFRHTKHYSRNQLVDDILKGSVWPVREIREKQICTKSNNELHIPQTSSHNFRPTTIAPLTNP